MFLYQLFNQRMLPASAFCYQLYTCIIDQIKYDRKNNKLIEKTFCDKTCPIEI